MLGIFSCSSLHVDMLGVSQKRTDVSHGNSLIARRALQRQQQKHRETIRKMQPSIDTRRPAEHRHLTLYGRDYYAKKRQITESAFNDLKMIQSIAQTMTRPPELLGAKRRLGPVSLNRDYRKKELFRITMENHALLDRLERLRPYYSTARLEKDYRRHMRYMVQSSAHAYNRDGRQHPLVEKMKAKERLSAKSSRIRSQYKDEQHGHLSGSASSPSLVAKSKHKNDDTLWGQASTSSSYYYEPSHSPTKQPATDRERARAVILRALNVALTNRETSCAGYLDSRRETQEIDDRASSVYDCSSHVTIEDMERDVQHETASRTVDDIIEAAADLFSDFEDYDEFDFEDDGDDEE